MQWGAMTSEDAVAAGWRAIVGRGLLAVVMLTAWGGVTVAPALVGADVAVAQDEEAVAFAKEHRWLYEKDGVWKKSRECKELEEKLGELGMKAPW